MSSLISLFFALQALATQNYPLVNQNGKAFQWQDLKGGYTLVSFIYTKCPLPTMCPLTVDLNKRTYLEWKKDPKLPKLKFLLVTLDPERDTPKVLKRYAQGRHLDEKRFILATGDHHVLEDLASQFNVMGFPGSGGTISHNMKSILIDPALNEVAQFKDNEWKPTDVIKALSPKNKVGR